MFGSSDIAKQVNSPTTCTISRLQFIPTECPCSKSTPKTLESGFYLLLGSRSSASRSKTRLPPPPPQSVAQRRIRHRTAMNLLLCLMARHDSGYIRKFAWMVVIGCFHLLLLVPMPASTGKRNRFYSKQVQVLNTSRPLHQHGPPTRLKIKHSLPPIKKKWHTHSYSAHYGQSSFFFSAVVSRSSSFPPHAAMIRRSCLEWLRLARVCWC